MGRRRYPMEPYLNRRGVGWFRFALRSARFRRTVLRMPNSVLRRRLLFGYFGWLYRRFNQNGEIPTEMFAPDIELEQSAALIDSAGSFRGHEGLGAALRELSDAFSRVHFEPQTVFELAPDRLLFLVQFSATGRGSGVDFERTLGHLFELDMDAGLGTRWLVFWEANDALEAAGLSE